MWFSLLLSWPADGSLVCELLIGSEKNKAECGASLSEAVV